MNVLLKIAEVMVRELRFQFFTELIAKLYHFHELIGLDRTTFGRLLLAHDAFKTLIVCRVCPKTV